MSQLSIHRVGWPARAVAEVGYPLALQDFRTVEELRSGCELIEIARAATQDDRHQVKVDFVDQPELHALAGEFSRGETDVPVAGDVARVLTGTCQSIGDKGEWSVGMIFQPILGNAMGRARPAKRACALRRRPR